MDLLKDKIELVESLLTMSTLSSTRKSVDSKTVPKN